MVLYQLAAVSGIARAEGSAMMHVKPHGALYNMAARDRQLAESIARAAYAADPELAIFAPPRSALAAAARAIGLRVVIEGFPIGHTASTALSCRVLSLVRSSWRLRTSSIARFRWRQSGRSRPLMATRLQMDVDTICIHGDTAVPPPWPRGFAPDSTPWTSTFAPHVPEAAAADTVFPMVAGRVCGNRRSRRSAGHSHIRLAVTHRISKPFDGVERSAQRVARDAVDDRCSQRARQRRHIPAECFR